MSDASISPPTSDVSISPPSSSSPIPPLILQLGLSGQEVRVPEHYYNNYQEEEDYSVLRFCFEFVQHFMQAPALFLDLRVINM